MTFTPLIVPPHSHVQSHSDLGTHEGQDVICLHDVSYAYDARPALAAYNFARQARVHSGHHRSERRGQIHPAQTDAGRDRPRLGLHHRAWQIAARSVRQRQSHWICSAAPTFLIGLFPILSAAGCDAGF